MVKIQFLSSSSQNPPDNPTTILIYWPYFKCLKIFGVFPLNMQKIYDLNGDITLSYRVHTSGPYFWLHCFLFGLLQVNTIFEVGQLLVWLIWPMMHGQEQQPWHQSMACLGWALYAIPATVIVLIFTRNRTHIGYFLEELHCLEQMEYESCLTALEGSSSSKRVLLEKFYTAAKRRFFTGSVLACSIGLLSLIGLFGNYYFISGWKYPVYWYSIISNYIENPLLKYGSFGIQALTVIYMSFCLSLVEVPLFAVAMGLKAYLRNNSFLPDDKPSFHKLQVALEKFDSAYTLMRRFNWLFRWVLFGYKLVTAAQTVVFCYIILRIRLSTLPLASHGIFFVIVLYLLIQLCILVPHVGSVYSESQNFIRSWKEGMITVYDQIDPTLRRRLEALRPFGFQCGSFYVIVPSTILTLMSVITTYLIVILQV